MSGFLIPFITIGLLEFGDKTQLMLLMLAAGLENSDTLPTPKNAKKLIFSGALIAFFIVDGVAVLLGSIVTTLIPHYYIKLAGGIFFVGIGVWILKELFSKDDDNEKNSLGMSSESTGSNTVFMASFGTILLAEWGDKTQIAAAMFATRFNGFLVLAGTLCALGALSAMAIWAGGKIGQKISRAVIHSVAGIIFIITGVITVLIR